MITVEQPFAALPECVVVLSPQYAEATDVFSSFFADGLCVWPFTGYSFGILRNKASTLQVHMRNIGYLCGFFFNGFV